MKKLFLYIFLGLVVSWNANSRDIITIKDGIKEIEVEGMSLGDSLLEYFSEEKIKETTTPGVYPDIYDVAFNIKETLRYDFITVTYKSNDKKYKIYGIATGKDFSNNIEDCYKEQDKIIKENSMNWKHWDILPFDEKDNSTYKPITYEDRNGNATSVSCYYFPEDPEINNLKVSLFLKEFKDYLKSLN